MSLFVRLPAGEGDGEEVSCGEGTESTTRKWAMSSPLTLIPRALESSALPRIQSRFQLLERPLFQPQQRLGSLIVS
jgi:hypothetical protein